MGGGGQRVFHVKKWRADTINGVNMYNSQKIYCKILIQSSLSEIWNKEAKIILQKKDGAKTFYLVVLSNWRTRISAGPNPNFSATYSPKYWLLPK